jgi:hypothetical protein
MVFIIRLINKFHAINVVHVIRQQMCMCTPQDNLIMTHKTRNMLWIQK